MLFDHQAEPSRATGFEPMQTPQPRDPVSAAHDPRRQQSMPHFDGSVARLGLPMEPLQVLEQRLGELGPKEAPIVLYCRSGNRSAHAASMMRAAGFTAIYDLGAIDRW